MNIFSEIFDSHIDKVFPEFRQILQETGHADTLLPLFHERTHTALSHNWEQQRAYYQTFIKGETIPAKEIADGLPGYPFLLYTICMQHILAQQRVRRLPDYPLLEDTDLSSFRNDFAGLSKHMMRVKLPLSDEQLVIVFDCFQKCCMAGGIIGWPVGLFLQKLNALDHTHGVSQALLDRCHTLSEDLSRDEATFGYKETRRQSLLLAEITDKWKGGKDIGETVKFPGKDVFATFANRSLEQVPPAEQAAWHTLLQMAQTASGSRPSAKYLQNAATAIQGARQEYFRERIHAWIAFLIDHREVETETVQEWEGKQYISRETEYLPLPTLQTIRGLIWMCASLTDDTTAELLTALAARSHRKYPNIGAPAPAVGNACFWVLARQGRIGHLSRLRPQIKQASILVLLEKNILEAASRLGLSPEMAEDLAVDNLSFEHGSRTTAIGEYTATVQLTGPGRSEIQWFRADGSRQKSTPETVKSQHPAALKSLKDLQKQLHQITTAQLLRIERMFRSGRKMPLRHFETCFIGHGILGPFVKKLVWSIESPGQQQTLCLYHGHWENSNGQVIVPDAEAQVSLWHPALASAEETQAWRRFISGNQIQQPLKQAYREVYLLTDAEVNTRTYSNRMAAHVLRQHQFSALAKARGWKHGLLGQFDSGGAGNRAVLSIQEHNMQAEFWVQELEETAISWIWEYISTDQVRFTSLNTRQTIPLPEIPPLVFTEVMRDVDLFVGVASVGNDPTWQDSGGMPAHRDYWQQYAFGNLTELANTRKEILASLVPRLKISKIATLSDRFLVVQGKLRTYKIHLGSSNILMEPNDQYLCIVPDQAKKNATQDIFLPFEGDNTLALILSKAFLLAADDKITDPTITRQINQSVR